MTKTFTFDRYGNRRFDEANTDTLASGCTTAVCNPRIDPATNKLVGYTFDNSGNTKVDANGKTFTYDAENKQIKVVNGGTTLGEYFYDGDGKRVKKIAGSEETIFIYNASGQLVAEYSNQIPQQPKVSYLTSDHLGSPRITTDLDGDVYTRRDFMPFGEEIKVADTPQRTTALNYASDEIRQKFTSYERDNETELDFAQARMYANKLGRFTSPDPLMASARISNPKTWNRYLYVMNNPLRFIDPDGMDIHLMDEKARNNVLKTLPEKIRKQVEKQIDKNGVIKKDALNKIKSKDQNFLDLKEIVNKKDVTEVMTATEAVGNGVDTGKFHQRTAAENKEYDIQNYMKLNNVSRADAETFLTSLGTTWTETATYGYTLNPSESPSGNLRIIVTDQTGEGASFTEEDAVVTTGHELYGHGLLSTRGKPYVHGKVPESFFEQIEKRTQTNYLNGQQKVTAPQNMKPKP